MRLKRKCRKCGQEIEGLCFVVWVGKPTYKDREFWCEKCWRGGVEDEVKHVRR